MRKALMLLLVIATVGGCQRIKPGYVGVVVENYGSEAGVDPVAKGPQRIWYNPITTDVYRFPTFVQTHSWETYSEPDLSFVVNSSEGSVIEFDVDIAVTFVGDQAPALFARHQKSAKDIVDQYVRMLVSQEFSDRASQLPATGIVGGGKQALVTSVRDAIRDRLAPEGIVVEHLAIQGEFRLDPEVEKSINAVLTAAQQAIQAQNRIVQATAEAQQKVEAARGDSLSLVIAASGQAEANRVLSQSLSPQLVQYETMRRWNGTLPTVTGGAVPFVQIP